MRHDDKTLANITDRTMVRLVNEEVVLPSRYLETFAEEEKASATETGTDAAESYRAVERSLSGQDEEKASVRSELGLLRHQLFSDDITEAKNRLWVYKQKLNARQGFSDFGYLASVRVADYAAIVDEYDANVGSKLLKMVSDYMIGYLKENHIAFEIARFSKELFLLFMHGMDETEVDELMANMQKGMGHYSFKHRNRIFKLSIEAVAVQYIENEPFASVLEQLEEKRFESEKEY
jgi:GGDEF domain-containing protein